MAKEKTKSQEKQASSNQDHKYPSWPMVRVTWLDAIDGETGWQDLEDIVKSDLAVVVDIGWLVKTNDKKTVIMGSWSLEPDDNGGGRYITIPTCWIKKIEYLEVIYAEVRN